MTGPHYAAAWPMLIFFATKALAKSATGTFKQRWPSITPSQASARVSTAARMANELAGGLAHLSACSMRNEHSRTEATINERVVEVTARKNFLRNAKFFPKTCCTISTISYNYEQVTSVFARFMSDVSMRSC